MPIDLEGWEVIAEGVKPDAAVEFWRDRAKLTWEEAKALADGARQRAFYVTGLARQDLVNLVSDGIQAAIENGELLPQFKERILAAIQAQGWHDYRVENIFRTNVQSAYAAGRYKKMQSVKASRPYWQYMAVMDKRTRPSHAVLHDKIYPADHPFWDSNYPPNGFRCRCAVVTLSERQVKAQGLTVEKEMPKADMWKDPRTGMEYFVNFPGADPGFRNNPFKEWACGRPTPDLKGKNPPAGWDYEKVRGKGVISTVSTNQELAAALKTELSKFTRNGPVTDVIFDNEGYFMATTSRGKYWISQRTFTRSNNFNPAGDLKSAWNKIAKGEKLTFNEEYAIESLWHETVHNRQTTTYAGGYETIACRMMETVTQWVARRTYPQFMESIGGKATHQKDILSKGYGYRLRVRNFDRLRDALGIADDGEMLGYFEEVIKNSDRKKYQMAITDYFIKKAKAKVTKTILNEILKHTDYPEAGFDELLRVKLGGV